MEQQAPSAPRFVDLSHPIRSAMAVAPGLPAPRVEPYMSHAASRSRYAGLAEFEITRLSLVGNTGTSLDSPYHRYPDGIDIAALSLERLVGVRTICLGAEPQPAQHGSIGVPLERSDLAGAALLIRTGWDRHWGQDEYWTGGPFLDAQLAEALAARRPALLGVDFANVDDPRDLSRPVHSALLGAGVPIIEHLRGLDALPEQGARLFAAPLPVDGAAAMPVRVFAELALPGRGR